MTSPSLRPTPATGVKRRLPEEAGIFLVLLVVVIVLSFLSPNFRTVSNGFNLLVNGTVIAFLALGQTFVLLTGGIDLSTGANIGMTGVIVALLMAWGLPWPIASLLGLCAANQGNWQASEAILREALAAKPDDAFARTNLGLALQGQGRLAEAIEAHRAALAIQRDDPWTHTNLGLALAAAGDAAGALDAHRTAIALGRPFLLYTLPQRRWALDELMRVYRELGAFEEGESGNGAG